MMGASDQGTRGRGGDPAALAARRLGREAAVRMLYQWEVGREDPDAVATSYWSIEPEEGESPDAAVRAFAAEIFFGTTRAVETIDPLLAGAAEHWKLSRVGAIERQVLRAAVYELRRGESPAAVIINEALELARAYSGEEAVGFVNGVLDAVRRRLGGQDEPGIG